MLERIMFEVKRKKGMKPGWIGSMPAVLAIQGGAMHVSGSGDLSTANNIAFGIIVIALLLGILLAVNYYRRMGLMENIRARRKNAENDIVGQFPNMTKEELRQMILKDRETAGQGRGTVEGRGAARGRAG